MQNYLRFALTCCLPLVFACSGPVRPLNDATGGTSGASGSAQGGAQSTGGGHNTGGNEETGGTPGSGGTPTTGGATGTGGAPGTGGNATSGGSSAAGAPSHCSSVTGEGCPIGFVCADDDDDCDARLATDCPGHCFEPQREPPCFGLGAPVACPRGLGCVPNPRDYLGTDPSGICVGDAALDSCSVDIPLPCAEGFQCLGGKIPVDGPGHCAPNGVSCMAPVLCPAAAFACPIGYTPSTIDSCWGPCVPIDTCACHADNECPANSVCDRLTGRCARLPDPPFTPPDRCLQPLDEAPCDPLITRFAFVDGTCVESTCNGNDNNFTTLEACLAICEGRPSPRSCPAQRTPATICVACGAGGGCMDSRTVCAKGCNSNADCDGQLTCFNGLCQMVGCI